jgi:hypothetical protein
MTRLLRPSRLLFAPTGAVALALLLVYGCGSVPHTTLTEIPDAPPVSYPNDSAYAHVLQRAVHPNGAINFVALQSDSELTHYLRDLAVTRTEVFTSRQQSLAFWLNAHNAYVLDILRNNQPLTRTGDLSGFKSTHVAIVAGKRVSLSEIEDHILTHDFREPRAFFALFDGARSSPDLRPEPYNEAKLSEQLDEQVELFLADSTRNYLDTKNNKLYLSEIFRHYTEEIEKSVGTTIRFVREFAPDPIAAWIDRHPNVAVSYLRYDESLNATPSQHHDEQPVPKPKHPRRRSSGGIE